jgi:hypothetical protein
VDKIMVYAPRKKERHEQEAGKSTTCEMLKHLKNSSDAVGSWIVDVVSCIHRDARFEVQNPPSSRSPPRRLAG